MMSFGPHGYALSPEQAGRARTPPTPDTSVPARKSALPASHAPPLSIYDRSAPAHQDFALDHPSAKGFFVSIPFVVPIVEPTDRRVTPIHHPDPCAWIEKCPAANQHLPLSSPFFEHEPRKVGRRWIDEAFRNSCPAGGDL